MKRSILFSVLFILAGSLSLRISAQVSIAPTAVFIHDQTNVSSLYVNNNSRDAQEITVSFEFAYPGSDSEGNLTTVADDTLSAARFGLTEYVKAFPRQFVLQHLIRLSKSLKHQWHTPHGY